MPEFVTSEQAEDFIARWDVGEWGDRAGNPLGSTFYRHFGFTRCCRRNDLTPISRMFCIRLSSCPGKVAKKIREFYVRE